MKQTNQKDLVRFILVLLIVAGLVSCSKDSSDPTPSGGDGVEGSWNMTAITISPAIAGITDILSVVNAQAGNDCLSRITFTFKPDGTIGGVVPAGCQDVADDNDFVEDNSKWKVTDKKLQITEGSDVSEFDLDVNKNEMKWTEEEEEGGVKYKYTIVFKRV